MGPRIEYANTADGVSIAVWTLGGGTPLVQTPPIPFSQVQLAGQLPEDRRWSELMAGRRRLVRYDSRGTGLSDRDATDFSLDALLLDLEAVVDHLELEKFVVWGQITTGPVAIAYTARHPERVSHLILWSAWARSADVLSSPAAQGFLALVDKDWGLFAETAAHAFFGWSVGELAHRAAVFLGENTTPEAARAMMIALREYDVTDLLSQVRCPTMVFHSSQTPLPDIKVARSLASRIPGARLVLLEGTPAGFGISNEAVRAIDELLGEGGQAGGPFAPSGTLVTLLFTDIVDSTSLTQHLGDAKAQELLRVHNAIVRQALKGYGGTEIKHTGDGIMASFASASGALVCAVVIQQAVEALADPQLRVHVGLNAGEPIAEEQDLFGTSVQLARRICDAAVGGEILASNVVRELAAGKGYLFADRGEVALRGFEDAVRLYEVKWREEGPNASESP